MNDLSATSLLLKLIDLASAGATAFERWQELRAKVQAMQGRDPTPEEWQALWDEIDADSAALDAADHRLNP